MMGAACCGGCLFKCLPALLPLSHIIIIPEFHLPLLHVRILCRSGKRDIVTLITKFEAAIYTTGAFG